MTAVLSQIPNCITDAYLEVRKSISTRLSARQSLLFWLVLNALVAVCICHSALAQMPLLGGRIIHQYWGFKDGAPEVVESLAQTTDGYLWLGTESGLFRFDGIRFEKFQPVLGDQFPATDISSLFAPPTGGLWIGYRFGAGFSFLKNGKLTNFKLRTSSGTVNDFAQDSHGIVWAARSNALWRFDGSTWQENPGGWNPKLNPAQVGFDREGILWVLSDRRSLEFGRQLFYLKPGGTTFQKAGNNLSVEGFTRDADHIVLTTHEKRAAGQGSGLELEGSPPAYPILRKNSDQFLDRAGGIWFLSSDNPVLYHPAGEPLAEIVSKVSRANSQFYEFNPYRYSRIVDREGSIWIGSTRGVHRFSYSSLMQPQLPKPPGYRFTVAPDERGIVWINSGSGTGASTLYRVAGEKAEFQRDQGGVANFAYMAPDKSFWFGGEGGLWHMVSGRLTRIDLPPALVHGDQYLQAIVQDRSGGMWVSFWNRGLYRLADGVWTQFGGRSDLPMLRVHVEFKDRLGRIWFGSRNNVLAVLEGERVRTFGPGDGIQVGDITAIHGRGSEIWIGGEFGLQQFDHGRFHTINALDKESLSGISGIVETANGDLWLNGLGGIFHVRRTEIMEALKNSTYRVSGERFGRREGLPGLASPIRPLPTAIEGTDGRLWFTVSNGVVWLDPARASNKVPPPPVTIQSISADDRSYRADAPIRFPAGTSSVQIGYAAVSLSDPEAIRFRYKLQETDQDWHNAAASNSVSYRNLPPGSYHFVVATTDANGLWSNNTATVEFTVLPAFYQTNWFRALCAAVFLALLWVAYRFRVRQLRRDLRQLQDVIETIPAMAWTAHSDGSNAFVNRRWAEYTGLSAEDTAGEGWMVTAHPEDLQAYEHKWRASIEAGQPYEFEVRFRCAANGEYRWFLARGVPLREGHGRVVRWYGILTDIEDRMRAEETLRESESRFRTFVDHVADAITVQDEQGIIVDVNRQGCEGLGYSRQEVVGKAPSASFCLNAEREAMEMELVVRRAAAGETVLDRHWHRRKNGTVFPVEVHTRLFSYSGRRFLLKAVRDISESVRAEEVVRRSEKQLRNVIDTIPGYVWSARPDGSLDFLNRRCLEFSGHSIEQSLDRGWEEVLHPEDRDRFINEARAAIESGQPIETEARYRRADGQYRWLLVRAVPLRDESGTIVKWYGVNTDIDDLKRVEHALRRSETYLAESQRLTHTGSWAGDHTTKPLYWSEELYRIFGFDPHLGLPTREQPLQRVHPEDLDKLMRAFDMAINGNEDADVEYRIVLPDGTVKYAHGIGHPVLSSNGEFLEVVGTTVDITDRKRAEEEREKLRQLEADLAHINRVGMMGELAASIAHEVNQPLSGIVSNGSACLRWLAVDPPNVEEVREAVRDIVRDGKRAGDVIARIRALTTRTAPPKETLDLNETIREVLSLVGDEAKKKSVLIRTQFADGVYPVLGDRVQLQQVLINLVMNGFEAMSGQTGRARELEISTRNIDPQLVQVTVRDSGTGLDQAITGRIFEPFYTTKSGGMGMGLSICRSIVQNHGGRLWATGHDGPGTSFHFTLSKLDVGAANARVEGV